jgi:chemotaxis protein histidine kinase CheA
VRGASGVGLGLAVVKRFSQCLGYAIRIDSKVGKGSVITIVIPPSDTYRPKNEDE